MEKVGQYPFSVNTDVCTSGNNKNVYSILFSFYHEEKECSVVEDYKSRECVMTLWLYVGCSMKYEVIANICPKQLKIMNMENIRADVKTFLREAQLNWRGQRFLQKIKLAYIQAVRCIQKKFPLNNPLWYSLSLCEPVACGNSDINVCSICLSTSSLCCLKIVNTSGKYQNFNWIQIYWILPKE